MLGIWQNSPNAPREDKLVKYTQKLIQAGNTSANILRSALIKEIDFDDLDPEKYGAAIKSKPVIYRAINEIDSGIKILERQIESKTLNFKEQEFKPTQLSPRTAPNFALLQEVSPLQLLSVIMDTLKSISLSFCTSRHAVIPRQLPPETTLILDEPQDPTYNKQNAINGWSSGEGYDWYYIDNSRTTKATFIL
jgi:hypothetical protein